MARRQSFLDKATKKKQIINCDVCGSPVTPTIVVLAQRAGDGAIKYKKNMVKICKCNRKEIYG